MILTTLPSLWSSWLAYLRDVPDAIYGVIVMFAVPILLLIYAARYHAKRRKGLKRLLPTMGFLPVVEPSADGLVPELLFYPNGLESPEDPVDDNGWRDLLPRVLVAWIGYLGQHPVTLMEVAIDRLAIDEGSQEKSKTIQHKLNQTVLRCDPSNVDCPPELLVKEHVLFKSRVRGARTMGGATQIGGHYFVYSKAPQDELERWITPRLRDSLSRHRLWQIAVHQGVFYLARGRSFEKPDEIKSFLEEGEELLSALLSPERS